MSNHIFDTFNIHDPAPFLTPEQDKKAMQEFMSNFDMEFIKACEEVLKSDKKNK